MAETDRLASVTLDDSGLPPPTAEIEQERRVALFDLAEQNVFALVDGPVGPYDLALSVMDRRLVFDLTSEAGAARVELPLSPFRQTIRDYFQICDAYFDAVKRLAPSRIEAIDAARREVHDEGAAALAERLAAQVQVDAATARRLFTLVCVLHAKG